MTTYQIGHDTASFANLAQRMTAAENRFLAYAMESAGLTHDQAVRALATLRKVRAIKIDAVMGQFTFTHGAFAAPDVLRRASEGR